MKQILTLLLLLLMNIGAIAQTKGDTLDLSAQEIKVTGPINVEQSNDTVIISEDRLKIVKLIFNLDKKDSVCIRINDNIIKGEWNVKNTLSQNDGLRPIIIKDGDELLIKIGSKSKKITFEKKMTPNETIVGQKNVDQKKNEKAESNTLYYILTGLIGLVFGTVSFWVYNKKKKGTKKKTVDEPSEQSPSDSPETLSEDNNNEQAPENVEEQILQPYIVWEDIRRCHMYWFPEEKSEEDWKSTLLEKLKKYEEDENVIDSITTLLADYENGVSLLEKIGKLKQIAEMGPVVSEPKQIDVNAEISKEVSTLLEEKLGRSDNKDIKDIWNKAKEEKNEPKDRLAKFVVLLESSLRNKSKGDTSAGTDFESELNNSNNRAALKSWFINQLRMKGIDVKNPNALLENIVEELKEQIDNVNNTQEIDENEIALRLTREGKLPQETITAIIKKLVAVLNEKLDKKLSDYTKIETLSDDLAAKLNVPNDFDEAIDKGKRELVSKFKDLKLEKQDDLAEIIDAINEAVEDSNALQPIFKQYGIDRVDGLVTRIRQKEAEDIKKKLNDEELAKCESLEQIVNTLIKRKDDAINQANKAETDKNENERLIIEEIQKEYSCLDPTSMLISESALEVFDKYQEKVKQSLKAKESELVTAKEKISKYEKDLANKESKLNERTEIITTARNNVKDTFYADIQQLKESVEGVRIMKECDRESKEMCSENEEILQTALKEFLDSAKISEAADVKPSELYEEAKQVIITEIEKDNGLINIISKYHAYSMQPFMTDKTREYGVRLERANITMMYRAISKVTNDFGIQLIVPALFAEKLSDGDYEDYTGKAYNDLDNFCPNSGNYKDNISSSDKTNIIVDLVKVGYRVDGNVVKTKVLI